MSVAELARSATSTAKHGWSLERARLLGHAEVEPAVPRRPAAQREILVIDDSLVARRYLEQVLVRSGVCSTVHLADSVSMGLNVLRERDIALVLCDLNMPEVSGLEFLHQMQESDVGDLVPIIVLTGEVSVESKVECLESGASDYLVKPFADEELIARSKVHLQLKELQDELRIRNTQLRQLACLDSLTGISNRHHFLQRLEQELNRGQRHGMPLSVGMIDIDHFKRVNDTYGHLCGDQALVKTASLLKAGLRDYDLIGRYGGEEFGVVFVGADAEIAAAIAERCRQQVASSTIDCGGHEISVTVSVGVASVRDPSPELLTELLARADDALYEAKQSGRNRVVSSTALGGAP